MPVYALGAEHVFPDPRRAAASGLLAVGGDLHPSRVLLAYAQGIFPWYSEGQPILWHSPDPRFVLDPAALHVPRSLRQVARRRPYRLSLDEAFPEVIAACAASPRPGQDGTWITRELQGALIELHAAGFAHSVEAWQDGALVGGLYGVGLGAIFFGESMFARAPDASKLAFAALVRQLGAWGFGLIDSQVRTAHVARFGAVDIPREAYLVALRELQRAPTRRGPWSFDGDPYELLVGAED